MRHSQETIQRVLKKVTNQEIFDYLVEIQPDLPAPESYIVKPLVEVFTIENEVQNLRLHQWRIHFAVNTAIYSEAKFDNLICSHIDNALERVIDGITAKFEEKAEAEDFDFEKVTHLADEPDPPTDVLDPPTTTRSNPYSGSRGSMVEPHIQDKIDHYLSNPPSSQNPLATAQTNYSNLLNVLRNGSRNKLNFFMGGVLYKVGMCGPMTKVPGSLYIADNNSWIGRINLDGSVDDPRLYNLHPSLMDALYIINQEVR